MTEGASGRIIGNSVQNPAWERTVSCPPREPSASARAHFRGLGYRWRHLLPDGAVDNPLRLFDPAFLKSTFLPGKAPARGDSQG